MMPSEWPSQPASTRRLTPDEPSPSLDERIEAARLELATAGFDIVQRVEASWYNELIASEAVALSPLPTFGRADAPGLLLGNSKALWPRFIAWLSAQPDPAMPNPLNAYVEEVRTREKRRLRSAPD